MASKQRYFWVCVLDDGTFHFEYNPDGSSSATSYTDLTDEIRNRSIFFGLTSNVDSYFFDLKTGELNVKSSTTDVRHPIAITVNGINSPLVITGPLKGNEQYNFYQYKKGHTDFDISFNSSGNVIDEHILGYTVTKTIGNKEYFIDVKLSLDPTKIPVVPNLEVTLRGSKDGPVIGVYPINI